MAGFSFANRSLVSRMVACASIKNKNPARAIPRLRQDKQAAETLLLLLQELARLNPVKRVTKIRSAVKKALDIEEARHRLEQWRWSIRHLRVSTLLTFTNLFIMGPGFITMFGLDKVWAFWLAGHLLCALFSLYTFIKVRRKLEAIQVYNYVPAVIMALLFPPSMARFGELFSRYLFSGLHSLAIAPAVLDREPLIRYFRRYFVALQNTRISTISDDKARTECWYKELLFEFTEYSINRSGIKINEILQPPEPEIDAASYCPRCHTQYRTGTGRCADCLGIDLVPL